MGTLVNVPPLYTKIETAPFITVLMPVYNGERHLAEAIESLLDQTFHNFEFLIINDGSTDGTMEILERYGRHDRRIRLFHQANQGVIASLNRGLDLARGKYIARMDADDVSLPERLSKQVAFMEAHPHVFVCESWVMSQGERQGIISKPPPDSESIRCILFFENAPAHPSVMFRKETLDRFGIRYDPDFRHAEDYELWVRCSSFARLANIEEVLLRYRRHEGSISKQVPEEQQSTIRRIRLLQLETLGIRPTDEEFALHESISTWMFEPNNKDYLMRVSDWLQRIKRANERTSCYPEPAFSEELAARWFAACCAAPGLGPWTWKAFRSSPLSRRANRIGWKQKIGWIAKFGIRSLNTSSKDIENSPAYARLSRMRLSNLFR